MADKTTAQINNSEWTKLLNGLSGEMKTRLARSMGVAGGEVLRNEARVRAPVKDGTLRASIYLAYRDQKSTENLVQYSVTWNSKKAPHGHLLEFGHWQIYRVLKLPDGSFISDLRKKLDSPKRVAAVPFLRPAFEAAAGRAQAAMIVRGRERVAELLAELKS